MNELWYLASPYTRFPAGLGAAACLAAEQAAVLIREGVPVYSPIAHSHWIAVAGNIDPTDHDLWMEVDRPFVRMACGLIVLRAETWQQSRGVAAEIVAFRSAGKPIFYMDPGVVPRALQANALQRAYARSRAANRG